MDKRRFLKATGATFVASLFASPFLARSASSSAFAQEGASGKEQFAVLQKQISSLKEELKKEIRDREAADAALSKSFIGSVVAIPYEKLTDVPPGWHLCDGTAIPQTDEYAKLRALGLENFPDYRGVFLRGLDDGAGKDPGRGLGSLQESANLKHSHVCKKDGAHTHSTDENKGHTHNLPFIFQSSEFPTSGRVGEWLNGRDGGKQQHSPTDNQGNHSHTCISEGSEHIHDIEQDGENESRPVNVSVRYIIKYA